MTTCLLLVAWLVSLGDATRGADGKPVVTFTSPRPGVTWENLCRAARTMPYRVLGRAVKKGMTRQEVERILGTPYCGGESLLANWICGGLDYDGLSVHYSIPCDTGIFAVDEVVFWPLFPSAQRSKPPKTDRSYPLSRPRAYVPVPEQ
jgi:hypothetical protein